MKEDVEQFKNNTKAPNQKIEDTLQTMFQYTKKKDLFFFLKKTRHNLTSFLEGMFLDIVCTVQALCKHIHSQNSQHKQNATHIYFMEEEIYDACEHKQHTYIHTS